MKETGKYMLIICGLGLYLFFLGNSMIVITDPVEANYALTASEMMQSGDYISPQIYGSYWYDKPILFYWELTAAFKLFGVNEFAARFFPAVFGVLGLLLTYIFASEIYDKKTGLYAALILATSFEYWLIAKTVITDMTLFVFFNTVLAFFYMAYTSEKKNYYYVWYFFAGLAVLTKGPIGILLPGFIIMIFLFWQRDWTVIRQLKVLPGMLLFVIVGGSWYYIMYRLHGTEFIMTFFGIHNVLRATVSEHPNYNVWYYYLVIFFVGFFPWSFALPMVIYKHWRQQKLPTLDMTTVFLLIWALTIAVFYQCMATKYTTYTLPYLLPIAILAARLLLHYMKFVKWVIVANVIFYTALTFFIVVPYAQQYSAKSAGLAVAEQVFPGEKVVSYGDYKTSAVFYSRQMVYRLEKSTAIAAMKPQQMSWSSKNVMPFLAQENIAQEEHVWAIVDKKKAEEFQREVNGSWQLIKAADKFLLFHSSPQVEVIIK